ncbi:hypothetical protein OYC64_009402 [Pagothenia borchgrevinki]|uniref:Uncharacterized protein n=1 Tax=Pagothenia borchgrevinki TaxID=8213 RepID=A0ABD2H416_PAGBO
MKEKRPLRALPIERGTKAMTPGSKALHGRPSGPIECSTVCFKKESERGRRGGKRHRGKRSKGDFLVGTSWKLWTNSI